MLERKIYVPCCKQSTTEKTIFHLSGCMKMSEDETKDQSTIFVPDESDYVVNPNQTDLRTASFLFEGDVPLFSVTFYNNPDSKKVYPHFQKKVGRIIKRAMKDRPISKESEGESTTIFNSTSEIQVESAISPINVSHYFHDYVLDYSGIEGGSSKVEIGQKFEYVVDSALNSSKVKVTSVTQKGTAKTCFNCGSPDHNLNECPRQKDMTKIQERRREFMKSFNAVQPVPNIRYHQTSSESTPKFVPGQISDTLRDALGMKKNDVPPYIYLMRVKGYPPGYSLQSYLNSNVTVFEAENGEIIDDSNPSELVSHMGLTRHYLVV
ncbi:Zinc finger CCHC domain-containing protein 8 [Thelohanellus kitauei]|uniref:Zinc finger CCHC domain-containing protein 8 n=1 Tax=Thelohanellus kitauei TaxID=669202 RepID=A0A0C2MK28_THEKT|nr:Zinc finger CCHC domain-containing protein 8 [Thelohanellus kitauei]